MTTWQLIEEVLAHKKPPRKAQWLGDKLDVSAQVLTNWKARGVPPSRYREIADALGLTVDQLEGLAPLPGDKAVGWPFETIPFALFDSLTVPEKAVVEERLRRAIDDLTRHRLEAEFLEVLDEERKTYFSAKKARKMANGR